MADLICHKGDYPLLEFWTGVRPTRLSRPAAAGALVVYVYDTTGYADADVVAIEAGLDRGERRTIATSGVDATAGTLTFTAALALAHPAGAEVMELKAPTTLAVTITDPSGNATSKAKGDLTEVVAGYYTYEATEMDEEGQWTVTHVAGGTVKAGGRDLTIEVLETER